METPNAILEYSTSESHLISLLYLLYRIQTDMADVSAQYGTGAKADHKANALKAQANAQFSAKNYPEATKLYGEAIALDPTNHVLYSNRSASRSGAKDYEGALEDAEKVITNRR